MTGAFAPPFLGRDGTQDLLRIVFDDRRGEQLALLQSRQAA
jgi:hypothetical protein